MNKSFDLKGLPGFPATAKLEIDGATSADIAEALLKDAPFPNRDIVLGDIKLDFSGKSDVPVKTNLGEVSFAAAASARLAAGVFDQASEVIEALALSDGEEIGLGWTDDGTKRYALLVAGYTITASAAGKHPLGALGSASFGIDAKQHSACAVIMRFDVTAGAASTLQALVDNWRFPANINDASDLAPGSAVLVEIDGELGLKLGAQLGYDFSFVREVQAGGLSGDLGLKVATKLAAEIGFSASGRFIVCVERPDASTTVRVRLFKLTKKGWSFALNLQVGAKLVTPTLPASADEFVQTVFGLHGQQVIADLRALEKWTDPKQNPAELVAGLASQELWALIEDTTGIDPEKAFTEARDKFLKNLAAWQNLPAGVSAWAWEELADLTQPADRKKRITDLKNGLDKLAAGTETEIKEYVTAAIGRAGFNGTQVGKLLTSLGTKGVLELSDEIPLIRRTAQTLQDLLAADFLPKLQEKIIRALNLQPLLDAGTKATWDQLDGWLLGRLSNFFGEELGFNRLNEIQTSIHAVLKKRDQLYQAVTEALKKQYEGEFALSYQRTTARTALLDVSFDLNKKKTAARAAFLAVMRKGEWEQLFLAPIPAVTLRQAVLTHGISRRSSLQLTLPMLKADLRGITDSLARLEITSEGEELVGTYELNATDERRSAGRFASRLALTAGFPVGTVAGQLRGRGMAASKWTYTYRQARPAASFAALRSLLVPIQRAYFTEHFSGPAGSFDTWLIDFDRQVESVLHNGSNDFGDLLLSFEVAMPGALVGAWFQPRDKAAALQTSCIAAKAIQRKLRELLLQSYLQDPQHLTTIGESLYALLVYASLVPANSVVMNGATLTFTSTEPNWNWPDPHLVAKLARVAPTTERLLENMATIRLLLEAENRHSDATFFAPHEAGRIIARVSREADYSSFLHGLLLAEALMIRSTTQAIDELADFSGNFGSKPADALRALARFGEEVTRTFNGIKSIYLPATIRTIGSVLFCEVTRAINHTVMADGTSKALLALTALKDNTSFKLTDFLAGKSPDSKTDVAAEQRLLQVFR